MRRLDRALDDSRLHPSPALLFDAATSPAWKERLLDFGLELVGRPGEQSVPVLPGDLLIRRGLGEGRLAVLAAVVSPPVERVALEGRGVNCEGTGDGWFVEVDSGGGRSAGLRIAGFDGIVPRDTVVLRAERAVERSEVAESGAATEDVEDGGAVEDIEYVEEVEEVEEVGAVEQEVPRGGGDSAPPLPALLPALYSLRARRRTRLREEYLRSSFEAASGSPPLRVDLDRANAELARRQAAIPGGPTREGALNALVEELALGLLGAAERRFILDPERSTLELLEPGERDRYLPFAWQENDFPGGDEGPNEALAERMFRTLHALRPERRANQGPQAVVRREEFDAATQRQVADALEDVPGERGQRLHRDASAAYVRARTAAAADGVTLVIGNAHRTAARAASAAARAENPAAVASFSSHTLGLAVDLLMSQGERRYRETTTRPFQNLVDMYRSAVHKWMFLRGESHGWFPYRREPWHWEYNPPGFRDRFRQSSRVAAPSAEPPPARAEASPESATDPVQPVRPMLTTRGSVGRRGRNAAADVRVVQDRLVELRALDSADASTERPSTADPVAESALARTIAAIESLQRSLNLPEDGRVDTSGATLRALNRSIPIPTAAEYAAVTARRDGIAQVLSRGFTLSGAVGATGTGNAPDDVRALQRRLVEIEKLPASHGEEPPAGSSGPVAQAGLRRTIERLRRFQTDVRFWVRRGAVSGAVTNGVAAPGDATTALLDRITAYTMGSGASRVTFRDHIASGATENPSGVMFGGTASPASLADADYLALGLTPLSSTALKFVSQHEGNFDAMNTYDQARVSAGFIQFAGERGLPPYLALLKSRQPAKFGTLLREFGIDVEFEVAGGEIRSAQVVVLDPAQRRVLRGVPAEQAIRDDKRLTTALLLSGRDRDVQLVQIEAATRDYVLPALAGRVSWGSLSAELRELIRTERGLAMLFDRAIQEGVGGGRQRFRRAVEAAHARRASTTVAAMSAREADVLAELERELEAGAAVASALGRATTALETLLQAARQSATTTSILGRSELESARRAIDEALAAVPGLAPALPEMDATLRSERARLAFTPSPTAPAEIMTALSESRRALRTASGPVTNYAAFLIRIRRIRDSTLRASLTEEAEARSVATEVVGFERADQSGARPG